MLSSIIGNIAAISCGSKCAIVWQFATREVWLCEVPVIGSKRALYSFHSGRFEGRSRNEVAKLIARLEADTMRDLQTEAIAMDADFAERQQDDYDDLLAAALELGIDLAR